MPGAVVQRRSLATISARVWTFSSANDRLRCCETVAALMPSVAAIALFE
jgi:hypothetical protein